jgi:hypothetical protein
MEKVKASIVKVGKAKGYQYVLNSEGLLLADGPNLTADVKKDLGFNNYHLLKIKVLTRIFLSIFFYFCFMINNNPIGLFDSGIGGTSIWSAIHDLMPNEDTIYLS